MIVLTGVIKEFLMGSGPLRVLDNIHLTIDSGEYVSIMGPSGSGKSTLLNILGCLDVPTQGSYQLEGHNTATLSEEELAKLRSRFLGFIFQRFHLIPRFNLVENVELPMMFAGVPVQERRPRATEALDRVGLAHRLTHRTNEISGGESQRVAIARALVMSPRLLLADEPTGNLDSRSGRVILDLLQGLHDEGLTVLLVTHDPQAGREGHRHLTLADGRVVGDERVR